MLDRWPLTKRWLTRPWFFVLLIGGGTIFDAMTHDVSRETYMGLAFLALIYFVTGGGDLAVWRMERKEARLAIWQAERDYRERPIEEPTTHITEDAIARVVSVFMEENEVLVNAPHPGLGNPTDAPVDGYVAPYDANGNIVRVLTPVCDERTWHEWETWYEERNRMQYRQCIHCNTAEQRHATDLQARGEDAIWMPTDSFARAAEAAAHQCSRCNVRTNSLHVVALGEFCNDCFTLFEATMEQIERERSLQPVAPSIMQPLPGRRAVNFDGDAA